MSELYRPVKRQGKLSKQVAEQIMERIVQGGLKNGDRLSNERELCQTFGVSRTVVREAISILSAKGLLVSQSGSGTYVRPIQKEDVAKSLGLYISTQGKSVSMLHLLEVRRLIEIRVAQKAAESATDEEIRQLEEIWSSMCGLVDAPAAFAEKDLEFHLALARASGNPLYGILLEPLTDVLLQLIFVGSNIPGTAEEACGFHKRVLEAVKARDVIGATEAMTAHLQQTERVTIQGLQTMKTRGSK